MNEKPLPLQGCHSNECWRRPSNQSAVNFLSLVGPWWSSHGSIWRFGRSTVLSPQQNFHPGRAASFQPGSVINSRDVGREQTTWTLSPFTQGRVKHCWVFKLSVNHQWALKGEKKRADNWNDNKVTVCSPHTNTGQKEWRNSFTKNTPSED